MIYKCMYCNFNAVHDSKCDSWQNWDYGMQMWFASVWGQIGLVSTLYSGNYFQTCNSLAYCYEELSDICIKCNERPIAEDYRCVKCYETYEKGLDGN